MAYVGGKGNECVSLHKDDKEDWHQTGLCFYDFEQERTCWNIFFSHSKVIQSSIIVKKSIMVLRWVVFVGWALPWTWIATFNLWHRMKRGPPLEAPEFIFGFSQHIYVPIITQSMEIWWISLLDLCFLSTCSMLAALLVKKYTFEVLISYLPFWGGMCSVRCVQYFISYREISFVSYGYCINDKEIKPTQTSRRNYYVIHLSFNHLKNLWNSSSIGQ